MSTAGNAEKLYTPEILKLAVELASVPFDKAAPLSGSARSQSCGSTIDLSVTPDCIGAIETVGMRVAACAIGQASASIFARHAKGQRAEDIQRSLASIEGWLSGEAPLPSWPDFACLAKAREFPGRHGAILLPWKAAREALSKVEPAR